ncbi:RNA polymerase sigma-70 factor (ECF subfamily) [Pedobacter sp. AK017]|uniref:RNA polymerase sigma factor n=1 Tax=Pedobacter sp. AK017 TaxID=2723073 RepID=UPI0018170E59|nr:RNA polymerase sigma-70 factor [Pedobacter sp. AK017]MBB5441283.1 RNA polymerase sigma-70 factor (ECF subfamily) [Pedobacter sp. AK017]
MESYPNFTDEKLVSLLQSGDQQAFTEIYHRYKGALYVHAYKRLRSKEDVHDILQELFASLWDKREKIVFTGHLSGYLYQAVRNRIFNHTSFTQVRSDYVVAFQKFMDQGQQPVTDHLVRENELLRLIEKEISELSPKMREVFELSRKGQLSHKEIAAQLSLSEKTVKKHINNALKILRVKLGMIIWLYSLFFCHPFPGGDDFDMYTINGQFFFFIERDNPGFGNLAISGSFK